MAGVLHAGTGETRRAHCADQEKADYLADACAYCLWHVERCDNRLPADEALRAGSRAAQTEVYETKSLVSALALAG